MKESLLLSVFMQAAIFLVVAALFVPLLKRIKIPGVLGYLIAGICWGRRGWATGRSFQVLQYVTLRNTEDVKILSELGIVFLLFVIGLELTRRNCGRCAIWCSDWARFRLCCPRW